MIATLSTLLGGIGLFLLGMTLMTDGLKAVAGDALRSMLANFTGSRAKAVATGAGITALVQSSSATTLATIGFVSAGLLSFNNAIGVVIGANLGTTSTGWIVSLLGLKFSIGTILLPFIGVGALMRLLGRGRIAHSGTALAGLGVIFVGIDVMQAGMGDLANQVDLSQYSATGLQARFLLVVIGAVMTVLMQSSSAAVATTLTALAAGTISVEQAAALVIGQNVGTTVTAGIASVGASVAAKRTAFVHVVFNLGTAFIAFFILPLFTALIDIFTEQLVGDDEALTIAAFHTAFNLLGAAVFLPLTQKLDRLASYVVVEKRPTLTRLLDESMCQVPSLAVNAAYETLKQCAVITLKNGAARLRGEQSEIINHALTEVRQATNDTGEFLAKLPSVDTPVLARLTASLHAMDHISQCANDVSLLPAMSKLRTIKDIREQADLLADLFAAGSEALSLPMESDLAAVIQQFDMGLNIDDDARTAILQLASDHVLDVDKALDGLAVLRSLDRLSHHGARAMHYLHQLNEETPETPSLAEVDERTVG